jgi:transposase InsO family protein
MDVKKIGKIPDGGGWRAHGRPATKAEKMRRPKIGYDYVHSLVDDHSRLADSEILTDEIGATCAAFLVRAAAYFAAHGIPQIERLITDNAWAYRHSTAVKQAVARLGAQHKFIKPHCPWQNGKALSAMTQGRRSRSKTAGSPRTHSVAWMQRSPSKLTSTSVPR